MKKSLVLSSSSFEVAIISSFLEEDKRLEFASDEKLFAYFLAHLEELLPSFQRFLSLRLHSLKEVENYLRKKIFLKFERGEETEFFRSLLLSLKRERIINSDEEFVKFWVRSRSSSTPRSLYGIKYELRQRGVKPEIIEKEIEKLVDEGEYDELEALRKLYRRYRSKDWLKFRQAAQRHRFRWETIQRLEKELNSPNGE